MEGYAILDDQTKKEASGEDLKSLDMFSLGLLLFFLMKKNKTREGQEELGWNQLRNKERPL